MTTLNFEHYRLALIEIIHESSDIYTFKFDNPNLKWEEGTNIHLAFDDFELHEAKKFVRHFSIMNLDTKPFLGFTTRLSDSPFKIRLKNMSIGDEMIVYKFGHRMPIRFEDRPIVLLSMGVGIAAIKPVMETYEKNSSGIKSMTNITISKDTIYGNTLSSIKCVSHFYTQYRKDLYACIDQSYSKDNIYYIVGSDLFLENMISILKSKGHSMNDIEIDKKADKKLVLLG